MSQPATRQGGCLCGAVRYEVRGRLRQIVVCHCGQCRRWTGHVVAATRTRRENLTILKDAALAWFESSPGVWRGFCGACGSSLFWTQSGGERVSIMAGSLDDPRGLRIAAHAAVADRAPYEDLTDDLPHLPGSGADTILAPEDLEEELPG